MKMIALMALIEVLSPRFAQYRPEQIGVEWTAGSDPVVTVIKEAELVLVTHDALPVQEGESYEFYIPSLKGYFNGNIRTYIEWGLHWYWIEVPTDVNK